MDVLAELAKLRNAKSEQNQASAANLINKENPIKTVTVATAKMDIENQNSSSEYFTCPLESQKTQQGMPLSLANLNESKNAPKIKIFSGTPRQQN